MSGSRFEEGGERTGELVVVVHPRQRHADGLAIGVDHEQLSCGAFDVRKFDRRKVLGVDRHGSQPGAMTNLGAVNGEGLLKPGQHGHSHQNADERGHKRNRRRGAESPRQRRNHQNGAARHPRSGVYGTADTSALVGLRCRCHSSHWRSHLEYPTNPIGFTRNCATTRFRLRVDGLSEAVRRSIEG